MNLSCVRACCVIAEERPRITLTTSFTKLFASLGLTPRAVSTSFGCRVNVGIGLQVNTGEREGGGAWVIVCVFLVFNYYQTTGKYWGGGNGGGGLGL